MSEEYYKNQFEPIARKLGIPVEHFWRNAIEITFSDNNPEQTVQDARKDIEIASLRTWIASLHERIAYLENIYRR